MNIQRLVWVDALGRARLLPTWRVDSQIDVEHIYLVPAFFIKQSVSTGNGHRLESKKSTYKNKDLAHRAMAFQPTMEAQSIFIVQ